MKKRTDIFIVKNPATVKDYCKTYCFTMKQFNAARKKIREELAEQSKQNQISRERRKLENAVVRSQNKLRTFLETHKIPHSK